MKQFFKDRENQICTVIFAITILVAIIPLMSRYCINGHDLEYHLLRIESLKEGILIGKPFMKVNTLFFGGAGYASSMFYSDLFMYIPALLRVCGLSIGASYHIFVTLIFVLCYASTFYCAYKMTDSKYIATIAAVLLTLCPYHMDDMLVRAACGEYMAFVFVPFVVYGIYNVLFEGMNRPYVFLVGYAGLILTHPATLVLCVIFTVITFLIFIKSFINNPKLVVKLGVVTIITLCVSAFQWLPMIEQMLSTTFYVSFDKIDMLDAALPMSVIFSQEFPGAGVLLLAIAFLRIFISSKDNKLVKYADVLLICGVIYAIGASNIVPWERLSRYLSFVQFPWRLFTITSVLLSFADAIYIMVFVKDRLNNQLEVVIFTVLAFSVGLAINHSAINSTGYYDYGDDYYSYKPYTANVIGAEWLPAAVTDRDSLILLSEHAYTDSGSEIGFDRTKAVITIDVPESVEYIDVPFIYYKGYKATILGKTGALNCQVTGEGINGMCRVYTDNQSGMLTVNYKSTPIQIASYLISLIAIAGMIVGAVHIKKKL